MLLHPYWDLSPHIRIHSQTFSLVHNDFPSDSLLHLTHVRTNFNSDVMQTHSFNSTLKFSIKCPTVNFNCLYASAIHSLQSSIFPSHQFLPIYSSYLKSQLSTTLPTAFFSSISNTPFRELLQIFCNLQLNTHTYTTCPDPAACAFRIMPIIFKIHNILWQNKYLLRNS